MASSACSLIVNYGSFSPYFLHEVLDGKKKGGRNGTPADDMGGYEWSGHAERALAYSCLVISHYTNIYEASPRQPCARSERPSLFLSVFFPLAP